MKSSFIQIRGIFMINISELMLLLSAIEVTNITTLKNIITECSNKKCEVEQVIRIKTVRHLHMIWHMRKI